MSYEEDSPAVIVLPANNSLSLEDVDPNSGNVPDATVTSSDSLDFSAVSETVQFYDTLS